MKMFGAVQRADEIASLNPKVAYYCRVYAIQQVFSTQILLNLQLVIYACNLSPAAFLLPVLKSALCEYW